MKPKYQSGSDSDSDSSSGSDVELAEEFAESPDIIHKDNTDTSTGMVNDAEIMDFCNSFVEKWDEKVNLITAEYLILQKCVNDLRENIYTTFDFTMQKGKYEFTIQKSKHRMILTQKLAECHHRARVCYNYTRDCNFFIELYRFSNFYEKVTRLDIEDRPNDRVIMMKNQLDSSLNNLQQSMVLLMGALCECYDCLSEAVSCDLSPDIRPDQYRVIPSVQIFNVITKLLLITIRHKLYLSSETYDNLRPTSFEYVEEMLLMRTNTPILKMNAKELMDSLKQLAACWLKLKYRPQLLDYIELLEIRAAMIINESDSALVHNVGPFRQAIDGTSNPIQYRVSDDFLWMVCMMLVNFRIRINMNFIKPKVVPCPEKWLPTPEQEKTVLDWLAFQAKNAYGDSTGTAYRMAFFRRILNPSETEEFARLFPSEPITFQQVLLRVRGDNAFKTIIDACNRPLYEDILRDDENDNPVSCATMADVLLKSFFKGSYPNTNWAFYCIFYEDLLSRFSELGRFKDPIMIQNFNYFNISYGGTVYLLEGFIKSLTTWINIILLEQNGEFESGQQYISILLQNMKYVQMKIQDEVRSKYKKDPEKKMTPEDAAVLKETFPFKFKEATDVVLQSQKPTNLSGATSHVKEIII